MKSLAVMEEKGVKLATLAQAMEFAQIVSRSGLAPKGTDTPEQVLVALQTGLELGLTPMRSLQSVVVVKGAASLRAETILALIRNSGLLEPGTTIEAGCRKDGDSDEDIVGFCRSMRKGSGSWQESTFSLADAKRAGLYPPTFYDRSKGAMVPAKDSPWQKYTKRMLQHRAVGFHGRDFWSDVTHGLRTPEELEDTPVQRSERQQAAMEMELHRSEPTTAVVTGDRDPLLAGDEIIDAVVEWPDESPENEQEDLPLE